MIEFSCKHFGSCGGCFYDKIGSTPYKELKKQLVKKDLQSVFDSRIIDNVDFIWLDKYSRRKSTFHIDCNNKLGFFASRSKKIIKIDECLICNKEILALKTKIEEFLKSLPAKLFTKAIITNFDNGLDLVFKITQELTFSQSQKLINFAKTQNINISYQINDGDFLPIILNRSNQINIANYQLDLASNIFIQATKEGLTEIDKIIKEQIFSVSKSKNLKIADIYTGFGAYSFTASNLAQNITAFEGSLDMIKILKNNIAKHNLNHKIQAQNRDLFQSPITHKELNKFDLIIINPPRNGATPQIKETVKSNIKNIIYISCNPKTFAFDSKILLDSGFKIKKLTILDQFIGSKHLEIVGVFSFKHIAKH